MADVYVKLSSYLHAGRLWDIVTPEKRSIGAPFRLRTPDGEVRPERFPSSEAARQWLRDHV